MASEKQRTILITGCSDGGLGAALAMAFHNAGWRVFASARNASRLKEAEAVGIETVQLDVTSQDSIAACVQHIKEQTGGSLDALLNNAGAVYFMPIMDVDVRKAKEIYEINVFGVLNMTQAFLPLLIRAAAAGGRKKPMVINNTSMASLVVGGTAPMQGAYSSSKAAAASMTETMRLELAPLGIRAINIVTGAVKSHIFDNQADNQAVKLPPTSVYPDTARETLEKAMSGKHIETMMVDATKWARQVVSDVDREKPPHWVWRGGYSFASWVMTFLPIGFTDFVMRNQTGLDVVERKIQENGGVGKLKLS